MLILRRKGDPLKHTAIERRRKSWRCPDCARRLAKWWFDRGSHHLAADAEAGRIPFVLYVQPDEWGAVQKRLSRVGKKLLRIQDGAGANYLRVQDGAGGALVIGTAPAGIGTPAAASVVGERVTVDEATARLRAALDEVAGRDFTAVGGKAHPVTPSGRWKRLASESVYELEGTLPGGPDALLEALKAADIPASMRGGFIQFKGPAPEGMSEATQKTKKEEGLPRTSGAETPPSVQRPGDTSTVAEMARQETRQKESPVPDAGIPTNRLHDGAGTPAFSPAAFIAIAPRSASRECQLPTRRRRTRDQLRDVRRPGSPPRHRRPSGFAGVRVPLRVVRSPGGPGTPFAGRHGRGTRLHPSLAQDRHAEEAATRPALTICHPSFNRRPPSCADNPHPAPRGNPVTIAWTPHPHRGGWLTASVEPQRADLYPRGNFPMDVTQDHTRLEEWVSNRDRQQANDRAHQFVRRWVQRPTERVNALRLSVRQVQAALG